VNTVNSITAATLGALLVLVCGSANAAKEGEWSWRVFDNGDEETLAITDTDLAGDNIKMPFIFCEKAKGSITIRGNADESLRLAMADIIRSNREPAVKFAPASGEEIELELFFSESWQIPISDIRRRAGIRAIQTNRRSAIQARKGDRSGTVHGRVGKHREIPGNLQA
jgi:hypothetical protein